MFAQAPGSDGGGLGPSLLTYISGGGFIGWIIVALSVVALTLVVIHAVQIRRTTLLPAVQVQSIRDLLAAGRADAALEYCSLADNDSFLTRILAPGLTRAPAGARPNGPGHLGLAVVAHVRGTAPGDPFAVQPGLQLYRAPRRLPADTDGPTDLLAIPHQDDGSDPGLRVQDHVHVRAQSGVSDAAVGDQEGDGPAFWTRLVASYLPFLGSPAGWQGKVDR